MVGVLSGSNSGDLMLHSPFIDMIRFTILRAPLVIFIAAWLPAMATSENRLESLGPLKRFDPNAEALKYLVKTHGRPALGLPVAAGKRIQRVSDTSWYLELAGGVARMKPDYKTGEVALSEVIAISDGWCVSRDGKMIFGGRRKEKFDIINECFDLATGKSKWTFERNQELLDAIFIPRGNQVVILHQPVSRQSAAQPDTRSEPMDFDRLSKLIAPNSAVVSWYDVNSGELVRRVNIPGDSGGTKGVDYLAFSGDRLYLTRPGQGDTGGECFVIKPGATEPEKITVEALDREKWPRVAVGGPHAEFVAFYGEDQVVLFRQEADGTLTKLNDMELGHTSEGYSSNWSARFTPDGNHLVLSSWWKTISIPTRVSSESENREFFRSSLLGDYSENGEFFVAFDDGGGRVRKASTWKMVESFESKIHPPHCCPITEAEFSISGNYIVSCDEVRLLLWSKDGQQLAELFSPRSETNKSVRMQSPVILEDQGKLYAADGYDFLVWDLEALHKRLLRKPDNIPRVKGEVVFRDRKQENEDPELMNIRMDGRGKNIITATRSAVRYRPLAASAPIQLPVPEYDIYLNPRSFMEGIEGSSVVVNVGSGAFALDLAGKKEPVPLGQDVIAADIASDQMISIITSREGPNQVWAYPTDDRPAGSNLMTFPADWSVSANNTVLTTDKRWIVATPIVRGQGRVLSVIDLTKQKIVYSQPLLWRVTSLALSENKKRLLVGSFNNTIYEFDFEKMTGIE